MLYDWLLSLCLLLSDLFSIIKYTFSNVSYIFITIFQGYPTVFRDREKLYIRKIKLVAQFHAGDAWQSQEANIHFQFRKGFFV